MKKITVILMAAAVLLEGCSLSIDDTEKTTTKADEQELIVEPMEEFESVPTEKRPSEEVRLEAPKVEIDYENLIDEREALDLAYNYLYEDSVYGGYSVYSDKIYHQGDSRWGYVIVQFAYDEGSDTPMYEKYDPDADLMIGQVGRLELLYDGMSENELFYIFWLCSYIRDDEEGGHRSTGDFIAVSIDGKNIACERTDEEGNEKPIEEWDWYYELISQ